MIKTSVNLANRIIVTTLQITYWYFYITNATTRFHKIKYLPLVMETLNSQASLCPHFWATLDGKAM